MSDDVLIYVDNTPGTGSDTGRDAGRTPGRPLATADEAFRRLGTEWTGRAEIRFKNTGLNYPIRTSAVYLGAPLGPDALSLVIRGGYGDESGYTDEIGEVEATGGSGDHIDVTSTRPVERDQLIGAVLTRTSSGSPDSLPVGTAISIRGNTAGTNPRIFLQRTMGSIRLGDTFVVQRPAVTLEPTDTLNLTSHDDRSPNLTLIGIKFAPAVGKGLNLLNVRAHCDTCEFFLQKDPSPEMDPVTLFVHTDARIQGGIEVSSSLPALSLLRGNAGVYIRSNNVSNIVWAARGGILGGHLTFKKITVRASQGGAFVPKSLEALEAPINILAGGAALGEPQREGRVVVGSWGTLSNKARIRNIPGDGLRVFNGASLNSPLAPIHLDVYGCSRDGIRVDMGSTASFGPPGGETGLVTTGTINGGFGMNVRNGSRALVGTDAATARVPSAAAPTPLTGTGGQAALDDQPVRDPGPPPREAWEVIDPLNPRRNEGLSLIRVNI